jgi:hypothetical protein
MIRYVLAAVCFLWGASAAIAQCPGSASPCEPYSTFVNSVLQATTTNTTDRSAYVHGATTQYVPPGPPFNLTINAAAGAPTVIANTPLNGAYISSGGSNVVWCPAFNFGCPVPGDPATITAQYASVVTTHGAANYQENGVMNVMFDVTGQINLWQASTSYSAGAYVSGTGYNVYVETVASCTSGSSDPSGTGNGIVDGSCLWNYEGPSQSTAKQSAGFSILPGPGGGPAWGAAIANYIQAGWNSEGAFGVEIDLTNGTTIDPTVGSIHTMDTLYLGGVTGTNPITTLIYASPSPNGTVFGSHNGLWINGPYAVKDYDIYLTTQHSSIGIYTAGNFGQSVVNDGSTAPTWADITGTYPTSMMYLFPTSTPADITMAGPGAQTGLYAPGHFSLSVIADDVATTAETGEDWAGTYSTAVIYMGVASAPNMIIAPNFFLSNVGKVTAASYAAGASNGVSCSGSPSGSFASVNGIVTHC